MDKLAIATLLAGHRPPEEDTAMLDIGTPAMHGRLVNLLAMIRGLDLNAAAVECSAILDAAADGGGGLLTEPLAIGPGWEDELRALGSVSGLWKNQVATSDTAEVYEVFQSMGRLAVEPTVSGQVVLGRRLVEAIERYLAFAGVSLNSPDQRGG